MNHRTQFPFLDAEKSYTNCFLHEQEPTWLHTDEMPPWRKPSAHVIESLPWEHRLCPPKQDTKEESRGKRYILPPLKGDVNNEGTYQKLSAAIMLRRPILVKGVPGIGKSSLAYYLADVLGLGKPLVWPINSKTTLHSGLYHYDAVAHLAAIKDGRTQENIGDFIHLNPLGLALYPWKTPRVLLIDELDKASYDLPNDLLYILEEGRFLIPELQRLQHDEETSMPKHKETIPTKNYWEKEQISKTVKKDTNVVESIQKNKVRDVLFSKVHRSEGQPIPIRNGEVEMYHPPIMVLTSNDERQFSDAFKRRCIILDLAPHDGDDLKKLVHQHLGEQVVSAELLEKIIDSKKTADSILQAIFLANKQGLNLHDIDTLWKILER